MGMAFLHLRHSVAPGHKGSLVVPLGCNLSLFAAEVTIEAVRVCDTF